ncbi:MAG: SMP-30/gluconolactonase/LRE family protein, partial [Deltaproteobacteria bacterium]|nr:SMP-30/gluconolactonase/LRE family protein [Deltaproteobacteria bacterium]
MKNTIIIFALLLAIIGSSDVVFGVETTLFGPKQYIRVSGSPDSYTGTFKAIPGIGTITVRNGRSDGEKRVEDSVSSASIKVNGTEVFGPSDFNKNTYLLSSILELYRENTLSVTLASALDSYITIEITEDLSPPAVSLSADPETTIAGRGIILQWDSEEADTVIIEPDVGLVEAHGYTTVFPVEDTTYTITAIGLGGTTAQSVDVEVTSVSGPTVSMRIEPSVIEPGEPAILKWSSTGAENLSIDNAIGDVLPEGSITVYPEHSTVYRLTASGSSGSSGAQARIMVAAIPEPQPEGSFGKQYQDMVPVDATLPAYNPEQFSVITGIVQDVAENPLEDVTVTILDHPQYGTAYTDPNGRYSIPVEGGGNITIVLRKQDYIEAQRRMPVPWNDVAVVGGVSMIKADPAYTVVKFDGNPHTILRHQSSRISDHSGTRACTLIMMGDNRAFSVDSHGNDVQELGTITVRATEYTTLKSMPAELPPNSAYTYCAEFSVDGARNVRFEKPVITWVDNFLGFDVGEIIPAGFYNRDRGVWIPADNGIVVMLLDTNGDGITDALDADGDGQADDLNRDGLLADEIAGLQDAEQYLPGSTFWRMSLTHFSPGDFNLPAGTPRDAERPNASSIMTADRQLPGAEDCKRSSGSFVEERSRIIHEDIPVPGTGLKLYYTSNRVNGYKTMVSVPASGATVPQSLKQIVVSLNIAGNHQTREFDPGPELSAEFYWDGTDYLGQALSTPVIAHARVGFVYDAVYYRAGLFDRAFAQPGIEATEISARQEIVLWKQSEIIVHPPRSKTSNDFAEGWSLSIHHHLNLQDTSILHKGDGTTTANNIRTVSRITGLGWGGYNGTNKSALDAAIKYPYDVTVDREGNVYFADSWNVRIRKVDTNGMITDIAGDGMWGFDGDGGPAENASFQKIYGVAVNDAGEIYIADTGNFRIRKIDQEGIISTIAGTGESGYSGDNGPATLARLYQPYDIALDGGGNLYIADTFNHRIRKVDPQGIITTIAGNGVYGFRGDNGPAVQASLWNPSGIAVHDDGTLYIADMSNHRIRKVDAQGIISTFAGSDMFGHEGDGGPADLARLRNPRGVAVDRAGNVYIADDTNSRIRQVSSNGIITTIAGNGIYQYGGSTTVPATQTSFRHPSSVAVDSDGSLYIADMTNHLIRKVSHPSAFSQAVMEGSTVFAEGPTQGHVMANTGIHLQTIDLDSGIPLYSFEYDTDGDLSAVIDKFGNRTFISRDENKRPVSITSPHGITTNLIIDEDNFLSGIVNPDGSRFIFEYDPQGLMTAKIEPVGNRFEHTFDGNGRVTLVADEAGGVWEYSRTIDGSGSIQVTVTTGEGNMTNYQDYTDSIGAYTSIITGPDNTETLFSRSADGISVEKIPS